MILIPRRERRLWFYGGSIRIARSLKRGPVEPLFVSPPSTRAIRKALSQQAHERGSVTSSAQDRNCRWCATVGLRGAHSHDRAVASNSAAALAASNVSAVPPTTRSSWPSTFLTLRRTPCRDVMLREDQQHKARTHRETQQAAVGVARAVALHKIGRSPGKLRTRWSCPFQTCSRCKN